MKEDNKNQVQKYYTPTIEEFHVGFEYESKEIVTTMDSDPYIWMKSKYNIDRTYLGGWQKVLDKGHIRVKYLDKEDIESLGFPYIEKGWVETSKIFRSNRGEGIQIYFRCDSVLRITKGNEVVLFEGTIKNKSELKKLMKQLNIIE